MLGVKSLLGKVTQGPIDGQEMAPCRAPPACSSSMMGARISRFGVCEPSTVRCSLDRWRSNLAFSCAGHQMRIRQIARAAFILLVFGCRAESAERCVMITGPRYNLVADTVTWSTKTSRFRFCCRGPVTPGPLTVRRVLSETRVALAALDLDCHKRASHSCR